MTTYQSLCDDYLQLLALDPNTCVNLGLNEKLDQLPDPSLAHLATTQQMAQQLRQKADELAPALTDFHQRLDAELIALTARQYELDCGLAFNGRLQAQQLPAAGDAISSGIFLLFTNDPRPSHERLHNITARLQQVPALLEGTLARLDTPVARWVAIDLETIEGLPDLFATIVAWAQEQAYVQLDELRTAVARASAALQDYSERLRQMPTTTAFSIGADSAQSLLDAKGLELSLSQIHGIAVEFVQRTRADIESLRVRLARKYELDTAISVGDLQVFLAERYAVAVDPGAFGQVIDLYRDTAAQIQAFIEERDLFPIPEQQAMNIMQTPEFMTPVIPAGAMMPPPALREGTRVSQVYLTLSEELMAEHTQLGVPVMMVHEGIPGHHLQLASATLHPSVVRRTFSANEHAEGWTTMLEDYMLDQGLMGELADEARFVARLDISRIGARVAIDLYFMTGDAAYLDIGYDLEFDDADPFVNAAKLLIAATGFTPGRAQAELNWYSQERGYPLSYLVGNHQVWRLKRDYQRAVADELSEAQIDRSFHQIYLSSGNMPVARLRRVFEHELQRAL